MTRLTSAFELEIFGRRNARSERLGTFYKIYIQGFGPEHRTSTNELSDFLENPPEDRRIVYFGLTYNGVPCGFATLMYYAAGAVCIVDHLVVSQNVRGYGAFFSFCELITSFLENKGYVFNHVVAEVMLNEAHVAATIKPLVLLRLMRIVGFRVARTAYWAPDPSIVTDLKGCQAALLLASQPERSELSAAEFDKLVSLIYQVHYGLWYKRTMPQKTYEIYSSACERILSKIRATASKNQRVVLNGMRNLDMHYTFSPNLRDDVPSLAYIWFLIVPAVVTVAIAFIQEAWSTAAVVASVTFVLVASFLHPMPRQVVKRFFRLTE